MKVIVVGAGPAGMMAAITARKNGHEVILLEKMRSVGRKLSITGKGRCNITNMTTMDNFIKNVPGNGKFLYSVFSKYSNNDLLEYLHSIGIKTKVERGERVFPVSDNAFEIIDALKKEMDRLSIKVIVNSKVEKIITTSNVDIDVRNDKNDNTKNNNFKCKVFGVLVSNGNENKEYKCDKLIIATGGKSYPLTGSTGDGYELAKEVGHTIMEPKASLVPLETYGSQELQGLSLKNVKIKITDNNRIIYEDFGEMIFTHFGVSGPIILSSSSHILRIKNIYEKFKQKNIVLHIDLKPALSDEKLDDRIQRDIEKYTRKQFKNSLKDLLPNKLIPYIIKMSKIDEEKQVDQITKQERKTLILLIKNMEFYIKDFRPIEEAIITAGGINIKEIDSTTLESKIVNGLYFAGEIIDVDAYTGGFNLQIAFSTGYVCGL